MRKILQPAALLALLILMTYAYLYPGSAALFSGSTTTVMSDDTDGATLPFAYDGVLKTFREHPSYMFYGSVYTTNYEPEFGMAQWMPWNERWIVVLLSGIVPLEQLSTALVFALLMMNAAAMYALGRYLGWSRSIAGGLGIAWAFCAFTRARAKVHMSMAGTYHLPLIFLGLYLVARGKGRRSLIAAAAAFLLAMTVVHYFITTSLFLAPVFLIFLALQPETRADWKRVTKRMSLAILPAVLFLGFNFAFPVPGGVKLSREKSFPTAGENINGQNHPFLYYFAARPIDYLGGDISLQQSAKDPNPLRESVNTYILNNLGNGNAHERSNGIRWILLILAVLAVIALARGKFRDDNVTRINISLFLGFAVLGFWLSLGPDYLFPGFGLSYWLHELVSQVRVPSRAGINFNFAVLMISGFLLSSNIGWRRRLLYPGVFPVLMVLSYPPLVQDMTMAPLRPVYPSLQREQGACGAGMYFPFVNLYSINTLYYQFLQRMRGSDCMVLNTMLTPSRLNYLLQRFPPQGDYLAALPTDLATSRNLELLARCVPLTWIAFDNSVPVQWREQMCQRLGWKSNPDQTCVAPDKAAPLRKFPDECG